VICLVVARRFTDEGDAVGTGPQRFLLGTVRRSVAKEITRESWTCA
jgi:hypothetical protein